MSYVRNNEYTETPYQFKAINDRWFLSLHQKLNFNQKHFLPKNNFFITDQITFK